MVIKNEEMTVTVEITKTTGVYRQELAGGGYTETRTSKTFRRTARVHVEVEITDNLIGMIKKAYRAKGHMSRDGALVVRVRELKRISDEQEPCRKCRLLHDYGTPCPTNARRCIECNREEQPNEYFLPLMYPAGAVACTTACYTIASRKQLATTEARRA